MKEVMNFVMVFVVAVGVAGLISTLYATGLRMWYAGQLDEEGNAHLLHRTGSVVCFSACVAIVLFALWLMVPFFH